jgi:hypothetical protein
MYSPNKNKTQRIVYNSRSVSPRSPRNNKSKKKSPIYAKVVKKPRTPQRVGIKRSNRGRTAFSRTKKVVSPPKKGVKRFNKTRRAFKRLFGVKEVPVWNSKHLKTPSKKSKQNGNNMVF